METQQTIREWSDDVFGRAKNVVAVLLKLDDELNETIRCLEGLDSREKALEELADCWIVFTQVAGHYSCPVEIVSPGRKPDQDAVKKHLVAMKKRVCELYAGSGLGNHALNSRAIYDFRDHIGWAAEAFGDLQEAVDDKMAVNRRRRWNICGDGTAQHISEPTPAELAAIDSGEL